MGRWTRQRYEHAMFDKTVKLYDKVIEGAFGKAGEEMDLRLATFIQKLDPESKEVQACFASLVQHVLWDKSDSRPGGSRVAVEPVAEPDAYPPGPRSRRLTRSPYPMFRPTEPIEHPAWPTLLDRAEPAVGVSDVLDTILPWSSAPPSRAHSPSARRRASPPLPEPRLRARASMRDRTDHAPRSPSPLIGRSTWELVDFYGPGDAEIVSAASPPRSPSRAWLDEYTAARPIAPRPRPRSGLPAARALAIRREADLDAQRLAAEIDAPPPLRQTRAREYEASEQRAAQRRRIIERRAGAEADADSPWVPYGDRDPYPQTQPPSLRRSGSSWQLGWEVRDAMGRLVRDDPAPRREPVEAETGDDRDTRRDGVVFEPLSPPLPSSAISAASGTEGRFGHSSHLPARGEFDLEAFLDRQVHAHEEETAGTSRNFGLGMRNVSVESLMGVEGVGLSDAPPPWDRSERGDPSMVDAPPMFGRPSTEGEEVFNAVRE